jgi:hypothetical protein
LWLSKLALNCIVPLQIKFIELSGTEKKALHEFKAKDVTVYGTCMPRLWRRLPPPGLRAAIAATPGLGPGIVLNFILLQSP